jgi:hypothetical protein
VLLLLLLLTCSTGNPRLPTAYIFSKSTLWRIHPKFWPKSTPNPRRRKCQYKRKCATRPQNGTTTRLFPTSCSQIKQEQQFSSRRLNPKWMVYTRVRTACPKLSTGVEQLVNSYNNLIDIIRFVARLFQQVRYSHDISSYNNIVTTLFHRPCNILVISWLYQTS